jgi:predicted AlkP superfamily phosphohydrolase/phosphomutase
MIGLDSADIDFLTASLGSLPNLRALFEGGTLTRLRSPAGFMSASVWPTFSTGQLPGVHGHYYPMQWDPSTMRLRRVSADWLGFEPWWYELGRRGLPITTLNVQVLCTNSTAPGIEVVNWGAQSFDHFRCNVPELGREIRRRFGEHPMGPDVPLRMSGPRLQALRRELLEGVRRRGELMRFVMGQADWRLCISVFTECHRAGHYFWPAPGPHVLEDPGSALLDVHRALDREIGQILAGVDLRETTVIVFALHSMGPNTSQLHFVPEVLDRINAGFRPVPDGLPARPQRSLMRVLRDRLPAKLQEAIARHVPESVRDWVTSRAFGGGIDWERAPGLLLPSGGEVLLRCNLVGRERLGALIEESEAQRRYVERVRDTLLELRVADTGAPLVRQVVFPTWDFDGPRHHVLPDVAAVWNALAPATEIYSPSLGPFRASLATGRSGNHHAAAFAVVAGRRPEPGQAPELRDLTSFAGYVRALLS